MRNLTVAFAAVLSLAATGCKKKGNETVEQNAKPAEPATAAGAPAAPAPAAPAPAAPAATCSTTAWKEPSGAFCVEAAAFTAGEISKEDGADPEMKLYFTKKDKADVMFNVSWFPKREAKMTAVTTASNMDSDFKNNKGDAKGEFYGGKGRFVMFSRQDEPKSHKLYAVVQGNKAAYQCEASSFDAPIDPDVVAACKSILPTD